MKKGREGREEKKKKRKGRRRKKKKKKKRRENVSTLAAPKTYYPTLPPRGCYFPSFTLLSGRPHGLPAEGTGLALREVQFPRGGER